MFDEQEHDGSVISRVHATCLIAEPIVVILEGVKTDLSIEDAIALRDGLASAICRVQDNQVKLAGDGISHNLVVLVPPRSGMSFQRSKLGD